MSLELMLPKKMSMNTMMRRMKKKRRREGLRRPLRKLLKCFIKKRLPPNHLLKKSCTFLRSVHLQPKSSPKLTEVVYRGLKP